MRECPSQSGAKTGEGTLVSPSGLGTGQADIAHKPDVAVAETDQISGHVMATLNVIGKHYIAFGVRELTHDIVAENHETGRPSGAVIREDW